MIRFLCAACALVFLAACSEPPRPAPAPKKPDTKATTAAVTEEPKEAPPESVYVYTPIGKRDPFQNINIIKEPNKPIASNRKPTPLQKWSIDQLKLAMTMTGTSSPFAEIEAPDGRGFPVHIGDFVGTNWGKVTAIQRDKLIITETITDNATGRVYPNNLVMKIPKTPQEEQADELLREGAALSRRGQ